MDETSVPPTGDGTPSTDAPAGGAVPPGASGAVPPGAVPPGAPGAVPPNAAGAVPPGSGDGFFAAVRRLGLARSRPRWVGGVCAGLADRTGLDPLLFRGLFAVSVLLGGAGMVAYGLAWALLPEREDGRVHAEQMMRGRFDQALLGAAALVLLGLGHGWQWVTPGEVPGPVRVLGWLVLTGVAVAVVVITLQRHGSGAPGPGVATDAPAWGTAGAPPAAGGAPWQADRAAVAPGVPPATVATADPPSAATSEPLPTPPHGPAGPGSPVPPPWQAPPGGPHGWQAPPARPHRGPGATTVGVVLGLVLLAAAGVQLAARTGRLTASTWLVTCGLAAVLLGAGTVVAGLRGRRAGALAGLGLVAVLVGVSFTNQSLGGGWRVGGSTSDRSYVIGSTAQATRGVSTGAGDVTVDLSGLSVGSGTVDVPVEHGVGDLTILVPRGVSVVADVSLGAGDLSWDVGGDSQDVSGLGVSHTLSHTGSGGTVHLTVDVGAGDLTITDQGAQR